MIKDTVKSLNAKKGAEIAIDVADNVTDRVKIGNNYLKRILRCEYSLDLIKKINKQ